MCHGAAYIAGGGLQTQERGLLIGLVLDISLVAIVGQGLGRAWPGEGDIPFPNGRPRSDVGA